MRRVPGLLIGSVHLLASIRQRRHAECFEMHREAVSKIDASLVREELSQCRSQRMGRSCGAWRMYGVRNSQASVLAPTGTIGLMMDCDTTGIEPDLGLVKVKKLVGGGTMSIVNQTVPRALKVMGYSKKQIDDIINYIDVEKSILGAPHLKDDIRTSSRARWVTIPFTILDT
jgi:ribonucleoside-diphosphate reductase alpha chain